jgi:hypothetical protein
LIILKSLDKHMEELFMIEILEDYELDCIDGGGVGTPPGPEINWWDDIFRPSPLPMDVSERRALAELL